MQNVAGIFLVMFFGYLSTKLDIFKKSFQDFSGNNTGKDATICYVIIPEI